MSENAETPNVQPDISVVDMIMDGDSHSPLVMENETVPEKLGVSDGQEEVKAPEAEKTDDSAKTEQQTAKQEADLNAAKQQINNLSKRLHDTQSAFHRANEERARLEKELQSLKQKESNDDDWFSEDDKNRMNKLDSELQANKEQLEQIEKSHAETQQQAALAQWELEAVEASKQHPDFDHVVYEQFGPLLDENTGDAAVRAMWMSQDDKSPAAAYKFAKTVIAMREMQNDPDAYRAKVRAEIEAENQSKINPAESEKVTGKEGLDLINSADANLITETDTGNESAVDFIFK
jgi:DNA repair exonuclease SbcCD ATPase subunit